MVDTVSRESRAANVETVIQLAIGCLVFIACAALVYVVVKVIT